MNWLDYVLLIIIGSSAISGLWRGFARTVVGTLAAVFAVLGAIWFYGSAASLLSDYVSHPTVANFLGFVIVFSVVMLGGAAVGWLLAKAFKWAGLGWLDRLLGGGSEFMSAWNGTSVGDLYDRIRISMPPSNPASVPAQTKVDIIAFVLKSNKFPAGKADLAVEGIKDIKFELPK